MATVTCKYCKKKFDRLKEPYIQIPTGQTFRYAHSQCYLDAVTAGTEKGHYQIWDPQTSTTCFWCHKPMYTSDDNVIPMKQLQGRFVHKACAEVHPANDKEKLILYIIQLYNIKEDYVLPRYMLQLSNFEKEYNFTYSGMLKALQYWYEVKHHPVNKDQGVGIIPYIYAQAKQYYYALWQANQNNQQKNMEEYIPKDVVVVIQPPERKIEKRKLFSFLDEVID